MVLLSLDTLDDIAARELHGVLLSDYAGSDDSRVEKELSTKSAHDVPQNLWNKYSAGQVYESAMRTHVFTFVLFLSSALSLNASEPLTIVVSPRQSLAPASLMVRVYVAPDVANRALEVVADSEAYYRSSRIQLDGDDAPATSLLQFRSLPGGDYEVRAILIDSTGRQRAFAREHVIVIPASGDR